RGVHVEIYSKQQKRSGGDKRQKDADSCQCHKKRGKYYVYDAPQELNFFIFAKIPTLNLTLTMENFAALIEKVSSALWGWPMIILLLGTHIYLTIILKFPQRKIFTAIRLSVTRDKAATGDVSQFGALATS